MMRRLMKIKKFVALSCALSMLSPGFALAAAPKKAPKLAKTGAKALPSASAEDKTRATAVFVSGPASWRNLADESFVLKSGDKLPDGATVVTGAGCVVKLQLRDGNELLLTPHTLMTLNIVKQEGGGWLNQIGLLGGALRGLVHKLSKNDRFEVVTSNAVAAVKGTDFEIETDPLPDPAPEGDKKPDPSKHSFMNLMPLPLRLAFATASLHAAGVAATGVVKIKVFSTSGLGVLLGTKDGKQGIRIPAGALAQLYQNGRVSARFLTAQDYRDANERSHGAAKPIEEKLPANAGKVEPSQAAKEATAQAVKLENRIKAVNDQMQLNSLEEKYGSDSKEVKDAAAVIEKKAAAQAVLDKAKEDIDKAETDLAQKRAALGEQLANATTDSDKAAIETQILGFDQAAAAQLLDAQKKISDAGRQLGQAARELKRDEAADNPAPMVNLADLARQALQKNQDDLNRQSRQDQQSVRNDLYEGKTFVDRKGYRVQLSQVVLRPDAATVQKVNFSLRTDGPDAGQSIFSHTLIYNQALPEDWTVIAKRPLNDPANLTGGSPEFFLLREQTALRSPSACLLCIHETYDAPQQAIGNLWTQGVLEQFGVQGADMGYAHYNALGIQDAGDTIVVATTQNADKSWQMVYTNQSMAGSPEMFTARVWLNDDQGVASDPASFGNAGMTSLHDFNLGSPGKVFEMSVTAPAFNGGEADVLVPSDAFLEAF